MSGSKEFEAIPESAIADEGTLALAVTKASDILEKAAEIVASGWTQGAFARDKAGTDIADTFPHEIVPTCFCVFGAINVANGLAPDTERFGGTDGLSPADRFALRALGFDIAFQLAEWNDAPDRTQAEVVAKLREAAALAQDQGQ